MRQEQERNEKATGIARSEPVPSNWSSLCQAKLAGSCRCTLRWLHESQITSRLCAFADSLGWAREDKLLGLEAEPASSDLRGLKA
eukprot:m.796175 g.796175  ORF g.796175 m.796175 type:complete len:85 (+) comp59245_c0_seq45:2241-2495(+)